jgi:polysaccharide pyruvyl transferase WcaK-like protein
MWAIIKKYCLPHFYIKKKPIKNINILVLGFYNRQNYGDDLYTSTIPIIFQKYPNIIINYISMDDLKEIPDNTNIVICGGGEIINEYFMSKAVILLQKYYGPIYALSVGIDTNDSLKYLHLFDHVFMRSKFDADQASKEIGSKNVTYIPDIAFLHPKQLPSINNNKYKIGICLAQPVFNNENRDILINNLKNVIIQWNATKNIEIHLFPFNTYNNPNESDLIINAELYNILKLQNISIYSYKNMNIKIFASMNFMICMRFHSVILSTLYNIPFVPVFSSLKIQKFLEDIKYPKEFQYKILLTNDHIPINIITEDLLRIIYAREKSLFQLSTITINSKSINDIILSMKKRTILIKNNINTYDNVLFICKKLLSNYLQKDIQIIDQIINAKKKFQSFNKDYENIARLICYSITNNINSIYLWGLRDNMLNENFCMLEAIYYIYNDFYKEKNTIINNETYYPVIKNRKNIINIDYMFQNDFKDFHRSGWDYVVGGLMNIDAHQFMKPSNLFLDTYLDRTFHWGSEILESVGIIPYIKPWIGFIHHTTNESYSSYNSIELFNKPIFIESLKTCKGLIVLSNDLNKKICNLLIQKNITNVQVYTLYHPMEFITNIFTLKKFYNNKNKQIIQIGAWLRNCYTIYSLPLHHTWNNKLNISKSVLKGKNMDDNFKPNELFNHLENNLNQINYNLKYEDNPCRDKNIHNKYCKFMYSNLIENDKSVKIIDKISNNDYDILLSQNIIFLNLVDASAVNTVLECIVRNTPLICNRLPALEEILGVDYPGFYSCIEEAASIIGNSNTIEYIYIYLVKLDKTKFALDFFIDGFQNIINIIENNEK